MLAKIAGRLDWSFAQVTSTPLEVVMLCERLGWRGAEGFERLQETPAETIRDFIVIAEMERDREAKRA